MAELNRSSIIAELQKAYEDELPTVEVNPKDSFFDTHTSTLMCVGRATAQRTEIDEAIEYFRVAGQKLSENPTPENSKKAKYCDLAANALLDLVKADQ